MNKTEMKATLTLTQEEIAEIIRSAVEQKTGMSIENIRFRIRTDIPRKGPAVSALESCELTGSY